MTNGFCRVAISWALAGIRAAPLGCGDFYDEGRPKPSGLGFGGSDAVGAAAGIGGGGGLTAMGGDAPTTRFHGGVRLSEARDGAGPNFTASANFESERHGDVGSVVRGGSRRAPAAAHARAPSGRGRAHSAARDRGGQIGYPQRLALRTYNLNYVAAGSWRVDAEVALEVVGDDGVRVDGIVLE